MRGNRLNCLTTLGLTFLFVTGTYDGLRSQEVRRDDAQFFETNVRPILVERCFECHGPEAGNGEAGLRIDSRTTLPKGGESGAAVRPGQPNASLLVLAVKHDTSVTGMPPRKKLPQREIDALTEWVRRGAPWPDSKPVRSAVNQKLDQDGNARLDRDFWAFRPVRKPTLPAVNDRKWSRGPIDRFVLSALEEHELQPAPPADARTLIRRASFDLLGLPPSFQDVESFAREYEQSPDAALRRLIDRYLASPHYGPRWGRHWLDVVRYADSNGMDDNMTYADAWRYRDYVIHSFNADKPFDQFAREQLAGDLLPAHHDWETEYEGKAATGFLMIGPKMLAEDDPVKQQMDIVDDQIDTIGRAFLGLTLGCARCHDHKFDPIPMRDYYALAGIFKSTRVMLSYRVDSKWNSRAIGNTQAEERLEAIEQEFNRLDETVVLGNFVGRDDEKKRLTAALNKVRSEYAGTSKLMAAEDDEPVDLAVFLRGNHLTRGETVPRGFVRVLGPGNAKQPGPNESGRRELAGWLTDNQNPLTARVIVNRVWQAHFGHGLVRSPDNFGQLGERPDNQRLLDWLAAELVEHNWSLKWLHRELMTSSTWRMSTQYNESAAAIDPDNRLLWRMNRRRLEAEALRDALLSVSGQLDESLDGPSYVNRTMSILSAKDLKDESIFRSNRRTVYLPVLRSGVNDILQAFDFPDPAVVNGRRSQTTIPSQALFLMNSRIVDVAAERLAVDTGEPSASSDRHISMLYERILGRRPDALELRDWRHFLSDSQADAPTGSTRDSSNFASVARVLFASSEFLFIE